MAIVLTPLASSSVPGPVVCSDLVSLSASESVAANGCPVVTKARTVIMDQNTAPTIQWEFRNRDGKAVDLSNCTGAFGDVVVRFVDPMSACAEPVQVDAAVTDGPAGTIAFTPPTSVANNPGIYMMQIGLLDNSGNLTFVNTGLLSVERSTFGGWTTGATGPLTLNEVRIQLRDTAIENDLRDNVEYDDTEILHSIAQPIMYWNEVPPPIAYFTPATFPFRSHWLRAVCANLLRIAATWYMRNKLQITHGGAQDDDRNRDNPYLQLAQLYQQEWVDFVNDKKLSINIQGFYSNIV